MYYIWNMKGARSIISCDVASIKCEIFTAVTWLLFGDNSSQVKPFINNAETHSERVAHEVSQ